MTGGLFLSNDQCFAWCAQQYIQVNHADITWMLIAGFSLLAFTLFRSIYPNLKEKPCTPETAEIILSFLVYFAMMSIIAYLVYYAFFYQPTTISAIVKNMSIIP